jgi:uncharacterized membrane protein
MRHKKNCLLVGTVFFLSSFLLFPKQANAWFKVCNSSSKRVDVAFGYLSIPDNREPFAAQSSKAWISEGWWTLSQGQCAQTYPHELWRRNRYYYVYAKSTDGRSVWKGNTPFCIAPRVFTLFDYFVASGACREYMQDNTVRDAPDARQVGFIKVDIGSGRVQNFTYRLTN